MLLFISYILLFCALILDIVTEFFTCQEKMVFINNKKISKGTYMMIKGALWLFYVIVLITISQKAVAILFLSLVICIVDNIISIVLFGKTKIRNESKYNVITVIYLVLIAIIVLLLVILM